MQSRVHSGLWARLPPSPPQHSHWTTLGPICLWKREGGLGMCLARVHLSENFKDTQANRGVAQRGSAPSSATSSRQPPLHLIDSHPTPPLCRMKKLGWCVLLCTVSQFWSSRHLSHPAADSGPRRLNRIRWWPLDGGRAQWVGSPQPKGVLNPQRIRLIQLPSELLSVKV